jgi:hypothetical protein
MPLNASTVSPREGGLASPTGPERRPVVDVRL